MLAGLDHIDKLHYSTAVTVLLVIGFNLVSLLLLEIPMVAFKVAPTQTQIAIDRAKEWGQLHWRKLAVWALVVIAVALVDQRDP